ncbi:RICIN domain-containing protein [Roseomonas elaeocarpi]|uniref:RICIN domain-containing protein n=1 Tax=Roseomonas elaeocarpi TaxID=907779 RepID=A0ABV6JM83_9PROT
MTLRMPRHWLERVCRPIALALAAAATITIPIDRARADADDLLAGAFDKVTGVPFATIMLGVVRSQASSPLDPAALNARLTQVEKLLQQVTERLTLVEERVSQLQDDVAEAANVARLRKLQSVAADLTALNAQLATHPTDAGALSVMQLQARQQADLLKDDPDFDVWKWTDITGRGTPTQALRTRFEAYPSFELYAVAIATWFATIEAQLGTQPQRVVAELGPFLRSHEAFLEARPGFPSATDKPVSLLENLNAAAFCRLEAVDQFSNGAGQCTFATVCIDQMADSRTEVARQSLPVNPARAGTLCTTSPSQSVGLQGEDALRDAYGASLMREMAQDLAKLAATGTLAAPFVGSFANVIVSQIFSLPSRGPVLSPPNAAPGSSPAIPRCNLLVGGGCSFGTLSQQTAWRIAGPEPSATGFSTVTNNGNSLCLDVKNNVPAVGAQLVVWPCNGGASQQWNIVSTGGIFTLRSGSSNLCATVDPLPSNRLQLQLSRGLTLQACDNRDLQSFTSNDGSTPGPH